MRSSLSLSSPALVFSFGDFSPPIIIILKYNVIDCKVLSLCTVVVDYLFLVLFSSHLYFLDKCLFKFLGLFLNWYFCLFVVEL
jgi:uncharacterized membrane protein YozB (DUF420 family)